MSHARRIVSAAVLSTLAALLTFTAGPVAAQVSLTTAGAASTQDFDSLASTGSGNAWTDNTTIVGWYSTRATYNAGTGSSNTGALYSFGSSGSSERALGSVCSNPTGGITYGVRLANNTGVAITSLLISYTGEQWRNGGNTTQQSLTFAYQVGATSLTAGTWTAASSLDFTGPIASATAAALDGNAAANRVALSATLTVSVPAGQEIWLRWTDPNDANNDHGLAVDDFSVTPNPSGPALPNLSVNDVSLAEGNSGTKTFTFTVSLSAPAGAGGVTFDIATADNTATTADNDYTAHSLTGQTIPAGSSTYTFGVHVNGDTTTEPDETFFVNVTNVTGANVSDGQGQGTIQNDDVTLTKIHDIQGNGASSPLAGNVVSTSGIVTGLRTNGFFIQEPDASVDADPATSEGVFVFTSSAPPAAAAIGALVQVTATVSEFVPASDPLQPPLTELTGPAVLQLSTGNALPAAIPLTATFPDPAGTVDQLERLEGMRVSVASLTVVAPTQGNVNEANATATSNGVFYGVVTGVARPFREPGIQANDPPPSGSIPPIPRFDANPERIRVDSDGLVGGTQLDVATDAVITGLVGPLDYAYRTYTVLPDPGSNPVVTGGKTISAVTAPTGSEFTVASYNLERFFDNVNDPAIGEPVLTAAAYDARLAKASLAIRSYLLMPDILGVMEVENLTTLQTLAARISADALAASQPDPQYAAYLVEGNDVGGIDVGFLVKTAPVVGATPRVTVNAVVQESAGTLFVNPDSSTELLNDRPPLRLMAVVNHANGSSFPVTVIANHLRSLNGVDDFSAGSNGWATTGDRVRAKRLAQAVDLANLVQARQAADPAEHIVLVGDFNAFEVNDGYVDSMHVVAGTPPPDNETAVPGDGVDLVNPDLVNLFGTPPPAERYSYSFDGNAQSLDHILVNAPLVADTLARREEHARIDADFPETARNNAATPTRLSDHDPVVSYYQVAAFAVADLAVAKVDSPDPVTAGTNLTYTITVTNSGPDPADTVSLSDTLPAGTTFVSLASPGGWSCTTPAVGAGGAVSCSLASFAVGSGVFTLTVNVAPGVLAGTVLTNSATAASTTADGTPGNESGTATTTVAASADLSVTKGATPNPVLAGSLLTYTIAVGNAGPSGAASAVLADTLPAGTTFAQLVSPGGWSCTTPAVGAGGTVSCTNPLLAAGANDAFTLVVTVDPATAGGTVLSNTATVSSATPDPTPGNDGATTTTTVDAGSADVAILLTDAPDPVVAGSTLVYTATASNAGPGAAASTVVSLPLPAGTTFLSLVAPGSWSCSTPAVGANGTVSCSLAAFSPGTAGFVVSTTVAAAVPGGTVLTATATISTVTADPSPGDQSATATTDVLAPAVVSATKTVSGSLAAGSQVVYTVVLTNSSTHDQGDNPGDEMTDVLPPEVQLASASAGSGTVLATLGTNTVTWNGSIPAGGAVTITIVGTVRADLAPPATVSNQATVAFDVNGDGTNAGSAVSDDPGTPASGDPTTFAVSRGGSEIPTLDAVGLGILAALLALGGAFLVGRRGA